MFWLTQKHISLDAYDFIGRNSIFEWQVSFSISEIPFFPHKPIYSSNATNYQTSDKINDKIFVYFILLMTGEHGLFRTKQYACAFLVMPLTSAIQQVDLEWVQRCEWHEILRRYPKCIIFIFKKKNWEEMIGEDSFRKNVEKTVEKCSIN